MTWGSASADRSIIASTPLPRTPVPPPERVGTPGLPGQGNRRFFTSIARSVPGIVQSAALRSTARSVPPGTSPELLGARVGFHRGTADGALRSPASRASPEDDNQHPSGRWAALSTGTGNPKLFGASVPPIPPEQGRRSSSEPREPGSTGARQTELFGAPRARFRPGQGNRTSSEGRRPRLTLARVPRPRGRAPPVTPGAAQTALLGGPRATPHGAAQTALFGGPRATPHPGPRRRHSSEGREQRLTRSRADGTLRRAASNASPGVAQTALLGGPRATLHPESRRRHSSEGREQRFTRSRADGTPRRAASRFHRPGKPASPGSGIRSSSERRAPVSRDGSPPPRGRAPELFGAPLAPPPGPGNRHSSEGRASGSTIALLGV
jgi:hypothetical protein